MQRSGTSDPDFSSVGHIYGVVVDFLSKLGSSSFLDGRKHRDTTILQRDEFLYSSTLYLVDQFNYYYNHSDTYDSILSRFNSWILATTSAWTLRIYQLLF